MRPIDLIKSDIQLQQYRLTAPELPPANLKAVLARLERLEKELAECSSNTSTSYLS